MSFNFGEGFSVRSLFHATTVVKNMTETRDLFHKVFGAESITIPYAMNRYAQFTWVGDVPIESTSPNLAFATAKRMFLQLAGNHWCPPVFWIKDMDDMIHQANLDYGYKFTHLWDGKPIEGVGADRPAHAKLYYSNPFETGIDMGLYEMDEDSAMTESTQRNTDPFTQNNYYEAPAKRDDVVSVERHAQHVLVTKNEEATLRFLVDFMGGKVFNELENPAAGTRSTFVTLGHDRAATVEVATPIGDGGAQRDLASNGGIYHRLDLKVHDFDGAMRHLERCGIGTESRGDGFAVTDPNDTFGLRFGLTAELTDGDPRI